MTAATPWRLIVHDKGEPAWNMAFDEATLEHAVEHGGPATLRFFDWARPAITIGYAIDAPATLELDECERRGVAVVRRVTGGGLVFHGWDLTYAITFPRESIAPGEGLIETYRAINRAFAAALERFGVRAGLLEGAARSGPPAGACFARPTRYDLVVDGKKLAGNAQRRRRGWLLNHGSMPLDEGYCELLPLLRDDREAAAFAEESVTLSNLTRPLPNRAELIAAIAAALGAGLGVTLEESPALDDELTRAEQLVARKYGDRRWNEEGKAT